MLIEQIIEFELRSLGLLVVHVLLKLVIFMTKQKSPNTNLQVNYYLLLKILQEAMYLAFTHLSQGTYKI